uniref:Sister chromatid cohesion protein n=1 Tax=Albugo laibachii Nc14 TaxID=890382 RepID=F0W3P7_9STRA|nr:nippedBlike protein putative [Albugo laibachii Nc14]|eukprot:CCA15717.1 nippedBlike protein putative [Albugo laibachii Nc14]
MRGTLSMLPIGCGPTGNNSMNEVIAPKEKVPENDTDILQIASQLSCARFDQIDSYEIEKTTLKGLPLIAQRLIATGCFEGRMVDTKTTYSRKRSHEAMRVVASPDSKESKSLSRMVQGNNSGEAKKITIPDDDDIVDDHNCRKLFTPESKAAETLSRYSTVLENVLADLGIKWNEMSRLEEMHSCTLAPLDEEKVRVICHTIRLLGKHDMIPKIERNMMGCIVSILDRQIVSRQHSGDTKSGEAEPERPTIKRPRIQRSHYILDIGACILLVASSSHLDRCILSEVMIDNCVGLLCQTIKNLKESVSMAHTSDLNQIEDERDFWRVIPVVCGFMEQVSRLILSLKLSDCLILRLSTSLLDTFVLEPNHHVAQLQRSSITVIRSIYIQYPSHRKLLLNEALTTMLKVPLSKRNLRTMKLLYSNRTIQIITALVVTLLQCSDPRDRVLEGYSRQKEVQSSSDLSFGEKHPFSNLVTDTLENIKLFSRGLINNCLKKDEDRGHRTRLENFLEDLLAMFIYPEWFGAEMLLELLSSILAGILHGQLSKDEKRLDAHYALVSLNLIGKMCTSIKTHEKEAEVDNAVNYDDLRALVTDETSITQSNIRPEAIDAANISPHLLLEMITLIHLREKSKTNVLYLDSGVLLSAKLSQNALNSGSQAAEESTGMWFQHFFDAFCDTIDSHLDHLVIPNDMGARVSLHATLRRGFCQSFDKILSHIMALLAGGIPTFRSRVMKVLAELVHLDPMLMAREYVRGAVYNCFVDVSISVRQAAVDLVGHYVAFHPTLFEQYFEMLCERLRDKGISVRRSVCKIFRRYLTSAPTHDEEIDAAVLQREHNRKSGCMRMLAQRIGDSAEETSLKKFILNTFEEVWFGEGDEWESHERLPKALSVRESGPSHEIGPEMEDKMRLADTNRVKQLQAAVTPSRVIHETRLKLYDSVNIAMTIIETIQHCNQLRWFVSLLKRLLGDGKSGNECKEDSSIKTRTKTATGIREKIEKILKQLIECLLQLEEGKLLEGCSVVDIQSQFLSCLRALLAFCEADPVLLKNHIELLMVYINGDERFSKQNESKIQTIALSIVGMVFSSTGSVQERLLELLRRDLKDLIFKAPPSVVDMAIKCYATLTSASGKSTAALRNLLETFQAYLIKHQTLFSYCEMNTGTRSSLQRALYSAGQIAAAYEKSTEASESTVGPNMENLFHLYLAFLRKPGDEACVCKALHGVKYLLREKPKFLLFMQQEGLLGSLLTESGNEVNSQCLLILDDILQYEENRQRLHQSAALVERYSSKAQVEGDQEGQASLIGSVAQAQLCNILSLCMSVEARVRTQALGCVSTLLNQGLVSPMHCVSVLVALEADQILSVQERAHAQLVSLHERFPTLLCAPSVQGISEAFNFQQRVFGKASVLRENKDRHYLCVYGRLYQDCFRPSRTMRNMFLSSLISQFSDKGKIVSNKAKVSADLRKTLQYYSYLAELLASLPYATEDEPLYLVHLINRCVSLKLSTILEEILQAFIRLGVVKNANGETLDTYSSQLWDNQIGDVQPASIPIELQIKCFTAFTASLLIYLKNHLKSLYALSDEKCQLYQPVSASKAADHFAATAGKSLKLQLPPISALVSATNPVAQSWSMFVSAQNTARDDQKQIDFDIKPVSTVRNRRRRQQKSQKEETEVSSFVHDTHILAT